MKKVKVDRNRERRKETKAKITSVAIGWYLKCVKNNKWSEANRMSDENLKEMENE